MPSLYFKYAAMNSGKSTQLLQAHYNYSERGMNAYAMTAAIDNRYGLGKITARIGLSLDATVFHKDTDLFDHFKMVHAQKPLDAILIDEAQFMTRAHVLDCARAVDELGIPVLCYGLKTDFLGNLFEGSAALLCYADKLDELKTICWCGKKATMNARLDQNGNITRAGDQIMIGGNDLYLSLCREHFLKGQIAPSHKAQKAA